MPLLSAFHLLSNFIPFEMALRKPLPGNCWTNTLEAACAFLLFPYSCAPSPFHQWQVHQWQGRKE
jgi:hypothetical protein